MDHGRNDLLLVDRLERIRPPSLGVHEGTGPSLSSAGGASGSFSVDLPGSGTYYLVLAPGTGFEYSGQAIRVSYRVAGIQPEVLEIGLPFVAAGIVGVAFGLRARARRNVSSVRAAEPSR